MPPTPPPPRKLAPLVLIVILPFESPRSAPGPARNFTHPAILQPWHLWETWKNCKNSRQVHSLRTLQTTRCDHNVDRKFVLLSQNITNFETKSSRPPTLKNQNHKNLYNLPFFCLWRLEFLPVLADMKDILSLLRFCSFSCKLLFNKFITWAGRHQVEVSALFFF